MMKLAVQFLSDGVNKIVSPVLESLDRNNQICHYGSYKILKFWSNFHIVVAI